MRDVRDEEDSNFEAEDASTEQIDGNIGKKLKFLKNSWLILWIHPKKKLLYEL